MNFQENDILNNKKNIIHTYYNILYIEHNDLVIWVLFLIKILKCNH